MANPNTPPLLVTPDRLALTGKQTVQATAADLAAVAALPQLQPFDGAISIELSDPVISGVSPVVVGVLGSDLYAFGNASASNAGLRGIRRLRKGATAWEVLTTAVVGGTHDFAGDSNVYGVTEYKGKLYCGCTSNGKIFRLDLTASGAFSALTRLDIGAGFEDAHPTIVAWDHLFIATYGNPGTPDDPGLYRWDGVAALAIPVIKSAFVGPIGICDSTAMYDGKLWATINGNGKGEILCVNPDMSTELIYQGRKQYWLSEWHGELVATRKDTPEGISVWRDGKFVQFTSNRLPSGIPLTGGMLAVGDELLIITSSGPYRYCYDGTLTKIPLPAGFSGTNHGGPVFWNGAIYWGTGESTQAVLKLPIGTDRLAKQLARPQRNQGGRPRKGSRVINAGTLGAAYTLALNGDKDVTLVGTLTANLTLTITGLTAGATVRFRLTQDATGGRTITFPPGTLLPAGVLALTAAANAVDQLVGYSTDGTALAVTALGLNLQAVAGTPFSPSSIANLAGWWKADAGTGAVNDGDTVQTWTDQSAGAHNLVQAAAAARPTYKLEIANDLPVLRFDGIDDVISASFALPQPCTIIVVAGFRDPAVPIPNTIVGGAGNTFILSRASDSSLECWAGSNTLAAAALSAKFRAYGLELSGATSKMFVDGQTIQTGNPGTNAPGGIFLGRQADGSKGSQVDVGEVLVYSRALTPTELAQLQAYLKVRWGVV